MRKKKTITTILEIFDGSFRSPFACFMPRNKSFHFPFSEWIPVRDLDVSPGATHLLVKLKSVWFLDCLRRHLSLDLTIAYMFVKYRVSSFSSKNIFIPKGVFMFRNASFYNLYTSLHFSFVWATLKSNSFLFFWLRLVNSILKSS